ncbi:MAG: hypothetical protein ACJAZF_005042, partial [Granulosicoccus sp.]
CQRDTPRHLGVAGKGNFPAPIKASSLNYS